MADELTNFVKRKISFDLVNFHCSIHLDKMNGMNETVIVLKKEILTDAEFKNYILEVEKRLKDKYKTTRLPMASKLCYLLKITHISENTLPADV